jgi:hypothetical protein
VPVSRALRRLLGIRQLEEQQKRLEFEAAQAAVHRLEHAAHSAQIREQRGRRLLEASARSGEIADRIAGLEESKTASRHASHLVPRISAAEEDAAAVREEFLAQRVVRRQVETLIEEAKVRDAIEDDRRTQQVLDDLHGARRTRTTAAPRPPHAASPSEDTAKS